MGLLLRLFFALPFVFPCQKAEIEFSALSARQQQVINSGLQNELISLGFVGKSIPVACLHRREREAAGWAYLCQSKDSTLEKLLPSY